MSVPKKRISKRRTRARRSHHALATPAIATCESCGNPIRPHYTCESCGKYKGRDVLKLQAKVEKKIAKKSATKKGSSSKETT